MFTVRSGFIVELAISLPMVTYACAIDTCPLLSMRPSEMLFPRPAVEWTLDVTLENRHWNLEKLGRVSYISRA